MIIGHSRPDATLSVAGTGADILSTPDLTQDGKPGTLTRFQWISGTQSTSSVTYLRMNWTGGIVPRVIGLSNISLPVGTKIRVKFRRSTDTAGTYPYAPTMLNDGQRIVAGPRGERHAWILVSPGATAVVGCSIELVNDVNGAASIAASTKFTVGEIVVAAGSDVPVREGPRIDAIDETTSNFSWDKQPFAVPGCVYRVLDFDLATDMQSAWIDTYSAIGPKIDRGQSCAYILRYKDAAGDFAADVLHHYAMLGIATRLPSMSHMSGQVFASGPIQVTEAPIPT